MIKLFLISSFSLVICLPSFSEDNLNKIFTIIDGIHYHVKSSENHYSGTIEEYWSSENIKSIEFYNLGRKSGFEEYYENGQIKTKAFFKNGKLDGFYQEFYSNGKIQSRGFFKSGKLEGEFLIYFKNGKLMHKSIYNNGIKIECEGMCGKE